MENIPAKNKKEKKLKVAHTCSYHQQLSVHIVDQGVHTKHCFSVVDRVHSSAHPLVHQLLVIDLLQRRGVNFLGIASFKGHLSTRVLQLHAAWTGGRFFRGSKTRMASPEIGENTFNM